MSKKFSILVPTRERTSQVKRLLDSIVATVHNINDIEVLFAIDEDDTPSKENLEGIINLRIYPSLTIKAFYRERSQFINRDYYNWLVQYSEGEFLWAVGDDVIFLISSWDNIIYTHLIEYLKNKRDKIVCAGIEDTTPKPKASLPKFPCFPLISREAFVANGFFLHPNIPTWGADYLLYLLYTKVNRYISIDDTTYLHHISIHTKTAAKDATAESVEKIFNSLKMNQDNSVDYYIENGIPPDVEKLKQYITSHGGII